MHNFIHLECWDGEPNNRPTMNEVVKRLIISQSDMTIYQLQNENFDNATASIKNVVSNNIIENFERDLSVVVNEIVTFIFEIVEKGKEKKFRKQYTLDYFNNYNINSKEIYNWILNNQTNLDSIFLLGYFNFYGIEVDKNYELAFNFFIIPSEKNYELAQYYVGESYMYEYGNIKNEKLAFEFYEKVANKNYTMGQTNVG